MGFLTQRTSLVNTRSLYRIDNLYRLLSTSSYTNTLLFLFLPARNLAFTRLLLGRIIIVVVELLAACVKGRLDFRSHVEVNSIPTIDCCRILLSDFAVRCWNSLSNVGIRCRILLSDVGIGCRNWLSDFAVKSH